MIGLSITSPHQLAHQDLSVADYLGVGPIYQTRSKRDADTPLGIEGLTSITGQVSLPVVAIGGIAHHNARAVMSAGSHGIAVVSAIARADDPRVAAVSLCKIVQGR